MTNEAKIDLLLARISLLQHRDAEGNRNITNKLRRRIRKFEGK